MTLEEEVEQREAHIKSIEEIRETILRAKDSVWVINNEIDKKNNSADGKLTKEGKGNVERNVGHLEIILATQYIAESGEDLSELQAAVVTGKALLAEETE